MANVTKQAWLIGLKKDPSRTILYDSKDCNESWEVLAGPVDVTFDVPDVARCPHCNKALPETEKPKLPLLPLVVGGVYRTRRGNAVKLISSDGHRDYPWEDEDGESYTHDGKLLMCDVSKGDLIERIA